MTIDIIINTPTIPGREDMLATCVASVDGQTRPPLAHAVELDTIGVGAWAMHNRIVAKQLAALGGPRPDLWVLCLDDDNALAPNYLEALAPIAQTDPADVAVVYAWPHVTADPSWAGPIHRLDVPLELDKLPTHNHVDLCALIRSTAWVSAGGLPTDVAFGDWSLWLELLHQGLTLHCVERHLWYYRAHAGQLSHRNNAAVAAGTLAPYRQPGARP